MIPIAWLLESFDFELIGTVLFRLLLTTVLTGAIGYERESVNQPAGFRTHTLVGVGACLVTLTAAYLGDSDTAPVQAELSRMGAAVVSGIGFLGAGTIMREGTSIRGLTTAASVWTVACIGLAVGTGFISGAIAATIITFITLAFLIRFEPAQRSAEDCRRNGSPWRRPRGRLSARSEEGAGSQELAGNQDQASYPGQAGEPSCLGVALDRDDNDILGIVQLLEDRDFPVQSVRVLDSGDSGQSIHVCLVTGPIEAAARAAIIDELLRDRRILRILPDSETHARNSASAGS